MNTLPQKYRYCDDQIACRFLCSPSKNETLVLTIPGGPSLSGLYLDPFLLKLASHLNVNVGIVDLPNHGDSVVSSGSLPLSYQRCLDMLDVVLKEIKAQCGSLVVFGQSFGARLGFDLVSATETPIDGMLLTGFPYKFQMSASMLEKINSMNLTGASFQETWAQILPLYTHAPLHDDVFNELTTKISLNGNQNILADVKPIELSAALFDSKEVKPPIYIVQGNDDGVVPDNNLLILKSFIPSARFYEIENCGHFPMIEMPDETLKAFSELMSRS